jgi:hypothetical protein
MDDITPTKKTVGVSRAGGTARSTAFNSAAMNPERSARPIPSMPTSTTPRGGKPVKLVTMLRSAQ